MNLLFNPSTFGLVLSAVNAAFARTRGSSEGGKLAADDSFYGQEKAEYEKTTAQRRAEKIFPLHYNANEDRGSSSGNPDVGILLHRRRFRRLQRSAHYDNSDRRILQTTITNHDTTDTADDYVGCGTMCKPAVCDCMYTIYFESGVACASEIDDVCNGVTDASGITWTINGCIGRPDDPYYQEYFINIYCPFAECIVDGGTFASCWCQVYKTHCQKYGNERYYMVSPVTISSLVSSPFQCRN